MILPHPTLAILLLTAALPAAAQEVSYQLSNGSRLTVVEFYSSPANQGTWGSDLLLAGVLEPGGTVSVTIEGGQCDHDVRMVLEDGQELIETVDICEQAGFTLEG